MDRNTASGVAVTMMGAVVTRLLSFCSQIVVGIYLSDSEVGVFATALGIIGVTAIFRAGGTHFYLPTFKSEDFEKSAGPFFWFGLFCGTMGAIGTWGVALPAESWYSEPSLSPTLFVMGLQLFLLSIGQHARAKMQCDLRFRDLARLEVTLSGARLAATIAMATSGYGPLALAVPVCLATFIETIYCLFASGIGRGAFQWDASKFKPTSVTMRWVVLLGVLATITLQADYLVGSLFITSSALGIYYFAYQFASQPAMMMTHNLQGVFVPVIARLREDPIRLTKAARTIFSVSMVFVPLVSVGMAAVFPSMELLIWKGKWAQAAYPVYLLSGGLAFSTVLAIMASPLMGVQEFRKVVRIDLWRAASVAIGALAGGWYVHGRNLSDGDAAIAIAAGVGLTTGLVSSAQLVILMKGYGVWKHESMRDMLYGIVLATLAGVGASSLGASSVKSILPAEVDLRLVGLLECAITITLYMTLVLFTLRVACEPLLRSTIAVLPARFQPRLNGLLRL